MLAPSGPGSSPTPHEGRCPFEPLRRTIGRMSLISTVVGEPEAVAGMYATERKRWGRLPNYAPLFALRPDVYDAWAGLNGAVKGGMSARRYELATLGAALALRSSYCSLAHGEVLATQHVSAEQVAAIARGEDAGLDPADAAIVAFAGRVARDASGIGPDDIAALHDAGLTDDDVFAVVLAAAARCFFSTVLDATGTQPDAAFRAMDAPLREV